MTDHRTLVAEHLDIAKRAHNTEMAQTHVAIAQVHATMAQTEQLRIGNLIAWVVKLSSHPTNVTELHESDVEHFRASVPVIREGLDL